MSPVNVTVKDAIRLKTLIIEICGTTAPGEDTVLATAQMAHRGQMRRSGGEYIEHPKEVARIVYRYYNDPVLCAVGLLHDTLEDAEKYGNVESEEEMASLIVGSFKNKSTGQHVLSLVRALTHEPGGSYTDYLVSLSGNEGALRVKLSDMLHNVLSTPSQKQLLKYQTALAELEQVLGGKPNAISDQHWSDLRSAIGLREAVHHTVRTVMGDTRFF